jgi:hypothetical protein
MVEAKARARGSAAALAANPPCFPRLRDDLSPRTRSIGPSWPVVDVRLGVKNVSRSGSARAAPGRRLNRAPPTSEGPPRNLDPDSPLTCRYVRGQVDRSTAAGEKRVPVQRHHTRSFEACDKIEVWRLAMRRTPGRLGRDSGGSRPARRRGCWVGPRLQDNPRRTRRSMLRWDCCL